MKQLPKIYDALGRHPVHPFPARMAPGIALEYLPRGRRRLRVLDPMMGSGTVVALARANGHTAVGLDIDPLAVLIAKTWTTPVDYAEVRLRAIEVLGRAEDSFTRLPLSKAYPAKATRETKQFVRYWFDGYARRQLTALSSAIRNVRDANTRLVLWCAFSRLIITKQAGVSLAKDLAHSRPHKAFEKAPVRAFDKFVFSVEAVLKNCIPQSGDSRGPTASVRLGDARRLKMRKNSVDLVITSPPYLNAIDYMRCSKFSLVWMGRSAEELRLIRKRSIGTEVGEYTRSKHAADIIKGLKLGSDFPKHDRAVLVRFIEDMKLALSEVARILTPGGRAVYVVGENTIRGVYVRNSKIVVEAARHAGLVLVGRSTRALPQSRRYLPPPSSGRNELDVRMRREVVLAFRKPTKRAPR